MQKFVQCIGPNSVPLPITAELAVTVIHGLCLFSPSFTKFKSVMFSSREMIELQRSVIKFAQQQSVNNLQHTVSIFCFILYPAVSVDFQVLFSKKVKAHNWLIGPRTLKWKMMSRKSSQETPEKKKKNNFKPVPLPSIFTWLLRIAFVLCLVIIGGHRSTRTTALYLRESWLLNSVIFAEWGGIPKWLPILGWLELVTLEPCVVFIYLFLIH